MNAYNPLFFLLMEIEYKVESNDSIFTMDPDGVFFLTLAEFLRRR